MKNVQKISFYLKKLPAYRQLHQAEKLERSPCIE